MLHFHVIIPARYASTRFPGKPLAIIAGKPMLQHVYERALQSGADDVVIATDDDRIVELCKKINAPFCMTSEHHQSGTDRLAEAVTILNYADDAIVVNVQGDEPLIPPAIIQQTAVNLDCNKIADISTLCEPIKDIVQLNSPNIAKVVLDKHKYALYFSRAPIPWDRDNFPLATNSFSPLTGYNKHIGIFAYRVEFLKKFVTWKPAPLELVERLEQLRALYYGAKIYVDTVYNISAIGVDTEADLAKVRALVES